MLVVDIRGGCALGLVVLWFRPLLWFPHRFPLIPFLHSPSCLFILTTVAVSLS